MRSHVGHRRADLVRCSSTPRIGWLLVVFLLGALPRSGAAQSFLPPPPESSVYRSCVVVAAGDDEFEEEVSFTGVAIAHGRLSVDETVSVTFEDPTQ